MNTTDNDAVGAAVYTTILTNTTNTWVGRLVPKAALAAGLSDSRLAELMKSIGTPALAANFGPNIVSAVSGAMAEATVHGIR